MIVKPFDSYAYTKSLNSFTRRISPSHEKIDKIMEELSLQEAGEFGEKYILNILSEHHLPEQPYIFHNVNLYCITRMQIDCLLISPSWCLVIEIKNLIGELTFLSDPLQLICEKDGQRIAYRSPEAQLNQYIFGLREFFNRHQIQMPIFGVILLPFTNAIIIKPPSKYPLVIGKGIINHIWNLPRKSVVNPQKVVEVLMESMIDEWNYFPLTKHFRVHPADLKNGVECPNCGHIPMKRLQRTWACEACGHHDMNAHVQALKDYYMLIDKTISPKEAIEFLQLRNRYEAKRILKANSIRSFGATSSRKYELTLNIPSNKKKINSTV